MVNKKENKKEEQKDQYIIRLREGLPYTSRVIKDGVGVAKLINEYGPTPFGRGRVDKGVLVSRTTYERLKLRDDTKRSTGGTPEFEFQIKRGE